MLDQSQTCPSCRSSKYSNPQLRLMVNTCGHSLCENCVEVLFVRGSGLCVQCKAPIRKVNFRYQLFEDPLVQKEVEIRKKLLSDFNKREEDFPTLEEYDLYLEKIEELVYNLMNDIDVDECKRYIENYKKENKEIIKKNRLKPSSSMLFYEAELEREQLLREKREKEDEERRQNLLKGIAAASAASNAASEPQFVSKPSPSVPLGRPTTTTNLAPPTIKPPASVLRPPPSQFYSPATSSRIPVDRVFIPPPPSALGGGLPVPPSACPPTMSGWIPPTSYHHHEVFLPPSAPTPRQPDAVVLPGRSMQTRSSTRTATGPPAFIYVPHEFEMCGPSVPDPKQSRWADILSIYTNAVIYPRLKPNANAILSSAEDIKPDLSHLVHLKSEDELDVKKRRVIPGDEIKKEESDSPRTSHIGLSHDLPPGACGIAPRVFLERWLQESRCGLFL